MTDQALRGKWALILGVSSGFGAATARSLAAEGKLSAIVLLALPPLMALYFFLVQPEYISLLFSDPIGITMMDMTGRARRLAIRL